MDVLIVDDNPRVRGSLARILRRAGLTVDTAENGLHALAALKDRSYRVVVCDIQMPFMTGIELYEELRDAYPDLAERVVFVTAWASEPVVREFLDRSGRRFLEKPFEVSEFLDLVGRVAAQA